MGIIDIKLAEAEVDSEIKIKINVEYELSYWQIYGFISIFRFISAVKKQGNGDRTIIFVKYT